MGYLGTVSVPTPVAPAGAPPGSPPPSPGYLNNIRIPAPAESAKIGGLEKQQAAGEQASQQANSFGGIVKNTIGGISPTAQAATLSPWSKEFNPLTNPGAAPGAALGVVKNNFHDSVSKINDAIDAWTTKTTGAQKLAATGELGVQAVNDLFTPITAVIQAGTTLPVVGKVFDGVNKLFGAIAGGGADAATAVVNALPLSPQTKKTIMPLARDASGLAAQILVGSAAGHVYARLADNTKAIVSHVETDTIHKPELNPVESKANELNQPKGVVKPEAQNLTKTPAAEPRPGGFISQVNVPEKPTIYRGSYGGGEPRSGVHWYTSGKDNATRFGRDAKAIAETGELYDATGVHRDMNDEGIKVDQSTIKDGAKLFDTTKQELPASLDVHKGGGKVYPGSDRAKIIDYLKTQGFDGAVFDHSGGFVHTAIWNKDILEPKTEAPKAEPTTSEPKGQPQGQKDASFKPMTPIGTGEIAKSRLAERLGGEKVDPAKLPTYNKLINKEDQANAKTWTEANPELAQKVYSGEIEGPKGITPESIFFAVRDKIEATASPEHLLEEAAKPDIMSLQATAMGQRIQALDQGSNFSSIDAIRDINDRVQKEYERANPGRDKTEHIKSETEKTTRPKIKKNVVEDLKKSMADYVKTLRC